MRLDSSQACRCIEHAFGVLLGAEEYGKLKGRIAYLDDERPAPAGVRLAVLGSGFFGKKYGTAESLPLLPLKRIGETPLLYGSERVEAKGGVTYVWADIVASTYFLTTRYEEVVRGECSDSLGRFPGRESLPVRAGFIGRPIVNEYGSLLRRWLRETAVEVEEPERRFQLTLTHDVDTLRKFQPGPMQPFRSTFSSLLGRRSLHNIPQVWKSALGLSKDPYDTFDDLFALDNSVGSVAAEPIYFVMAGGQSKYDRLYELGDPLARATLKSLNASGARIGLHISYEAGVHAEKIAAEKANLEEALGRSIELSRYHILNWRRVGDGWELARAGIRHDYTLGYADAAGFRLGVCHPIPLFDPVSCQPFGITAHPLTVMECTLSEKHYMDLSEEAAFECAWGLIEQTRRHKGECVLLWHNHKLANEPGNYHLRLYRRLLHRLAG